MNKVYNFCFVGVTILNDCARLILCVANKCYTQWRFWAISSPKSAFRQGKSLKPKLPSSERKEHDLKFRNGLMIENR